MKKLIAFGLGAFLFAGSFQATAQLKFGVKLGANISHVSFDKFNTDNISSFTGGPMIEFMTPILGIGLDAAVMYSGKGYKDQTTLADNAGILERTVTQTSRLHYIDIPVNFKWKFGLPMVKVYLAAGPGFGFLIDKNLKNIRAEDDKKFDLTINAGGGVELFKKVQIGVQYGWGVTNALSNILDGNGKNRNLQITGAFLF